MKKFLSSFILFVLMASPGFALDVDPAIPAYKKVSGVSGTISSVGSDTMNNMMALWCEGFTKVYPNVKCQIEGKGSSTAPPALISGTSNIGPMSRKMKGKEEKKFESAFGYKPIRIRTAMDALAVFLHKDNPVECMSIKQVDAVFSKTRKCGGSEDIVVWGQLGLKDKLRYKPISIYGRNSASGTYGYFKKKATCKGDYKDSVKEQPGSSAVVQGITNDITAIGYSGIGYKTSGVKAIALSKKGKPCADPTVASIEKGTYPLARFLQFYVNQKPGEKLEPLVFEFIQYALSKEGQEVVIKDGYIPLNKAQVDDVLAQLNK